MWEKLKIMSSDIWFFIIPFIRSMMKQAGPILAAAAIKAVTTVAANSGASGADKRAAALDIIGQELQTAGIKIGVDVSTSLVNASLEMAVQKFKE